MSIDASDGRRNVLFFHQSAELYGSDRVLLNLLTGIRSNGEFHPIVLLPSNGPLLSELTAQGIEAHVIPLAKISRSMLTISGLWKFLSDLAGIYSKTSRILKNRHISVAYSNTLAVFAGALWAKLAGVPHVWHVHEIILEPRLLRKLFPRVVDLFSEKIIFISLASRDWMIAEVDGIRSKAEVIWNGVPKKLALPSGSDKSVFVPDFEGVTISLVGRINAWKGHFLLLEAGELLARRGVRNFRIIFAGSVPAGKDHLLASLKQKISNSEIFDSVVLIDRFVDSSEIWRRTDIAAVPSTSPEPFGLVAIEAMSWSVPVVAAQHGGLTEIVEDHRSGLLFEPCNAGSLADSLQLLINSTNLRHTIGERGKRRQESLFSLESQLNSVSELLRKVVKS